jgi:hypothetical protein
MKFRSLPPLSLNLPLSPLRLPKILLLPRPRMELRLLK